MSRTVPFRLQHEPPPPEAPVPTGAVQTGTREITVTFDLLLADGSLDATNWSATGDDLLIPASDATAIGNDVVILMASSGSFASVMYSPPPFDVVGENGAAAEGFVLPV